MAGKSKRNKEDSIPEGLDDLLNELTGNKNNKEDSIPEGLDDLLNELTGNKNNKEDSIPEGLDDLLNELTGNKNNKEDSIPEGLDDLLNEIKGKKSTATKPKRKRGRPRKKKTSPPGALTKYSKTEPPGALTKYSKTEDVDSRILELLGLEYTFDLDYDDYANLLKEKLIEVSKGTDDSSTEDAMLLREELKKARENKGKGTFKVKKKISKDSFTNFNVGGPKKDTAQTRKPAYALLQGKEIAEKTQKVDDLKEEKKERKQSDNQILKSISKSLDRIIGILSKQLKFDKDQAEKQRKLEERGKRKDKENKMESAFSKGIKALAKVAGKIFSPLQDFFEKIIRFFTVIFLGKVVKKFLEWFTDPKNESKIKTIGRLLKTFWPAILAGIVFLNPLGRLITKAVFVIGKGVAKLLTVAIPSLLKFGMRNPIVAAALAAVGLFTFGAWGPKVIPGLTNDEEDDGDEVNSYKRGGKITTESGKDIRGAGVDTQLIAARPGEIVINKETVNAVGSDYLLGLNRQYGGTNANKPKTAKVQAASGGGLILPAFANGGPVGGEGKEESRLQKPRKPNPTENELDKSGTPKRGYSSGSLISDPLGALDRILGQSSGDKFRLPGSGSEPPKSQPEPPESKPKESPAPKPNQETSDDQTAMGIPEKMLKSPTFRDSGLLYLRHLMGGLGGAVTEQDLSKETKHELNLAIGRAKERHAGNLAKATREWEEAKKGGWNKSSSKKAQDSYAARKSQYERLKSGQVQVLYQDYYDGNDEKNITGSAEDAKSVLGQFWAQQTKDGGYRIVNEKYDFQPMNDPLAVLMGDSRGIAKYAKDGKPGQDISLRNRLQAIAQLNPFTKDMTVDMILGQPETAERKTNNILRKMGGVLDFLTFNTTDFDGQGIVASSEAKGEMGVPFPETPLLPENVQKKMDEKAKLTAEQIKNNQAYATSKGKYYSSTTGKTYENYAAALKDPAVAAAAKKAQHSQRMSMAKLMNNNSAGLYYSSTTGKTYANYAEALKDPQVAAAAEVEKTKQKFSFAPPSKPSQTTASPKPSQTTASPKPSQTTASPKPKRWAMDPRGWFGMEGGGLIKENTGIDIPRGGTDRQLVAVSPGEGIVTREGMERIGGPNKFNEMVANLDSNSTPAKMGLRNKNISEGILPYSVNSSDDVSTVNLPMAGMSGGPMFGSMDGSNDEFHSPFFDDAFDERQRILDTMGITAFA